jgi:hypothetical protein
MKTINDMTHEEIVALSVEELNELAFVQMAVKGVKLPEKPVEPIYKKIPEPTKVLWTCDAFSFHCDDKAVLDELIALLLSKKDHLYTGETDWSTRAEVCTKGLQTSGWGNKISQNSHLHYTQDEFSCLKSDLQHNKELKTIFDEQFKAYEEEKKEADEITSEIYSIYNEHIRIDETFAKYAGILGRYLNVAKGDKGIAWDFFVAAYDSQVATSLVTLDEVKEKFFKEE